MEALYERGCGLDVHKKTVVACVLTPHGKEIRTFATMTTDLLLLADWLVQRGVTHVAMESTGVYWKPLYNLLEELDLELLLVNPRHMKAVPGRKTDMKDAEWIADLLRHGLLQGSFVPERPQRELRELVRYRRSLIRERSRVVNRIEKVLEGANLKLTGVITDVLGVSGRAMLEALVAGVEDPSLLADLATRTVQKKRVALEEALQGKVGDHQQLMLAGLLRHVDFLDEEVTRMDEEVALRLHPFEESLERLDGIPGVGRRTAEEIVAEIGSDMSRFPTAAHLASWARLCPGNNESAGKRQSSSTGQGNPWLRAALTEAAWAASHTKATYLSAQYHRLAAKRGPKRAIVALAHTLLIIIYSMLRNGTVYKELGANYFDERNHQKVALRAVHRLEALGYKVTLEAA